MINFKNIVSNNFNKAYNTYDIYAKVQKQSAHLLVNLLKENYSDFYPKSILDLGTGTGYVVSNLACLFPKSVYTINDISCNMVHLTTQKLSKKLIINTEIGDMEVINFKPHDLIISNFAFQWLSNLQNSIKNFYKKCQILAFSCLLDGTFKELTMYLEKYNIPLPILLNYPTQNSLYGWLKNLSTNNILLVNKNFEISFENIANFLKYLKYLGAKVPQLQGNFNGIKELFLKRENFTTCYNVLFVILFNNNYADFS